MDTLFTLSSSSSNFLFPTPRTKLSLAKPPTHLKNPVRLDVAALSSPLQCDPSLPPPVQTFWQWLRDEGIVVSAKSPATKPALVPEGMGLIAHRDISKNEVVLEVPKRLWINPDTVSASEIGSVCNGLKPWVSVALFLIREKSRADSKWRTYLDILPESTNSTVFCLQAYRAELSYREVFLLSTLDALPTVIIQTVYEMKRGKTSWMVVALISSAAATTVDTYWDIVIDWGLLRKTSKNKYLRDRLLVSHKTVYFSAMVIRRGIWSFFRLENEHLNNVGQYCAFKSVPLPFGYYDEDADEDDYK